MSSYFQRGFLNRQSDKVLRIEPIADSAAAVRQGLASQKSLTALVFGVLVSALAVVVDTLIDLWAGGIWLAAWTALWLLGFVAIALRGALVYRGSDKTGNPGEVLTPRQVWLAQAGVEADEAVATPALAYPQSDIECPRDYERRARRPDNDRRTRRPSQERALRSSRANA